MSSATFHQAVRVAGPAGEDTNEDEGSDARNDDATDAFTQSQREGVQRAERMSVGTRDDT